MRLRVGIAVGAALVGLLLAAAVVALVWPPAGATTIDIPARLLPASPAHWLGTDGLGRDIAAQLLAGARNAVAVGVFAVGLGALAGVAIGLLAAARPGVVDGLLMRVVDFGFAFPALLTAIVLAALHGPGLAVSVAAIGVFNVPVFARITRGTARGVWSRDFVLAARVAGRGRWGISVAHVLPNIAGGLVVQATLQFAGAVLAEAALSYLGLGTQPPMPSWGRMLAEAQLLMFQAPWLAVWPGLAIAASVLGLNLLGDGLRDAWSGSRAPAPPGPAAARVDHRRSASAPAPATGPLLDVRDLRVTLPTPDGPATALHDITFTLGRGETLGLVGESGSGKSLTALALMGLLPDGARATGRVAFDGIELLDGVGRTDAAGTLRGRRIAMIFQEPMTALNPLQTIGQQVAEPLRLHLGLSREAARAEALRLLARVRLPDPERRLDAWPHQLSGGQRQRAMIAMMLACGPELLIADEPTTALDAHLQHEMLALVAGLVAERGMALVLVSHDLGLIARHVQRVGVMYGGTLVDVGPVADVFARRAHPYTRALLAARPRLDATPGERLPTLPGRVPALGHRPAGCPFANRCSFVIDACHAAMPPTIAVAPGHAVRCIRTADVTASSDADDRDASPVPSNPRVAEPPAETALNNASGLIAEPNGEAFAKRRGSGFARPLALPPGGRPSGRRGGSILSIDQVWKQYALPRRHLFGATPIVRALEDVSFTVEAGRHLGIVGASGSGKSTLARIVLALETASAGRVTLLGRDLHALSGRDLREARRDIQMVFQDPQGSLDPRQRVGHIVAEPLPPVDPRERDRRVAEALDAVGLQPGDARRHPREFSGGQRQRIAIARALITRPRLIVADEPVSALDVSVQAQVLNLMTDLQAAFDITYLLISHDLAVVAHLCPELIVLDAGRIVERGPTARVFDAPQHATTRALIAAARG